MATELLAEKPHFPAILIYDPGGTPVVQGADSDHSIVARVPRIITIENNAANTDISVQAKVHNDATWQEVALIVGADGAVQSVTFDPRWNFVQLVRGGSTGTQDVIAYAQS